MGYRRFPTPRAASARIGQKCPKSGCNGTVRDWDCACSWGCPQCWIASKCDTCHASFKGAGGGGRSGPPKQKRTCPHCGVKKYGLEDHIRDKHSGTAAGQSTQKPSKYSQSAAAQRAVLTARFNLTCPDCGAKPMVLRESVHGLFYGCPTYPKCRGAHGAHADGRPKGKPANAENRKYRILAHSTFDVLWNGQGAVFESRQRAYQWMQNALNMTPDEAHIGNFDIKQCVKLIDTINECFGDDLPDV